MMNDKTREELLGLAGPMAQALGLTVWGIEMLGGQGRHVVRIYLDAEDGVTVDQCARFSRDLSVVLDVEDVVPGSYYLEVSSPGLDRPFFSPEQMRGYEGQAVQAALHTPLDGRRRFGGVLARVDEDGFSIEEDGGRVDIRWTDVKKANLRYEFPAKGKKKKA